MCAGISEPIANSGWKRTARSPDSLKYPRGNLVLGCLLYWLLARNLDRIAKSKDAKQAWSIVRSLSGKGCHTTGKSTLFTSRVYASDRDKASAFVKEYAKISSRKSFKDSRIAVMDLRCLTRPTRTTKRQQIKEAFNPVNFSRRFLG